jgi:hypothetical protein
VLVALFCGCPTPDPDEVADRVVDCTAAAWASGWERVGDGPVLEPRTWEDTIIRPTSVIPWDDGLRLYYLAASFEPCGGEECLVRRVGLALSSDGSNWTRAGDEPVIDLWADEVDVSHGSVGYDLASDIHSYWYGRRKGGEKVGIGLATSPDGLTWTASDAIALERGPDGAWDDDPPVSAAVLAGGSLDRMWYGGTSGDVAAIGLALWEGGWVRWGDEPVLAPGPPGSYTERSVSNPTVVDVGGCLVMSFTAVSNVEQPDDETIGIAVSTDGRAWERGAAPALVRSAAWEPDGVVDAALWVGDDAVWMLYTGADTAGDGGLVNSIGVARRAIPWLDP